MTNLEVPEDPTVADYTVLYADERAKRSELEREVDELRRGREQLLLYARDLQVTYDSLQQRLQQLTELNDTIFRLNDVIFKLYEEKQRLAIVDDLTGLYNHRYLTEVLPGELQKAQRLDYFVGLLIADLDSFKTINDTFGHMEGDEILRRVGRILQEALRRSDIVARYGGEEFVVILPGCRPEYLYGVAEKLRTLVADARLGAKIAALPFGLTTSVGGATFPVDAADADTLLKRADDALYEAKRSGRNRVCITQSTALGT